MLCGVFGAILINEIIFEARKMCFQNNSINYGGTKIALKIKHNKVYPFILLIMWIDRLM
jgi:hypothetical protein